MMDELIDKLKTALEEEKEDAEKYMGMAATAEEKFPGAGYDGILRDIAREEMKHHKHLQEIIHDMRKNADTGQED